MPIPGTILTYLIGTTMVLITVLVLVRKHFGKEVIIVSEDVKEKKKEVSPEPAPPVPVTTPAEPKPAEVKKEVPKSEAKAEDKKDKPEKKKKRGWFASTMIFLFCLVVGLAIITAATMYVWDKVNTEVPRGARLALTSNSSTARPNTHDVHMLVAKMFNEKLPVQQVSTMLDIVYCESSFRQFDKNGNVLVILNGLERNKDSAVGVMMIKEIHRKEAESLGYNIDTAEGNIGYGIDLFLRVGYAPWSECVVALAVKSMNGKTTLRLIDAPLSGWSDWVTVGPSCHIENDAVVRVESDKLQKNGTHELDILPVGQKQDPFPADKLRFATRVGDVSQKVRYICTE